MWAGCRIFVSLNFWVSVQMFTLSLSWRRLREEVFMDLGQSEISDKGQSRTFWSLRSRLWEIICRILLEAALAVLINIHSPTQCFYTLNRKSPVKMNTRDIGKAQWDHMCWVIWEGKEAGVGRAAAGLWCRLSDPLTQPDGENWTWGGP